jgi:hypothetical protein
MVVKLLEGGKLLLLEVEAAPTLAWFLELCLWVLGRLCKFKLI